MSQQTPCALYRPNAINAYESKGLREMFRGHEELLEEHPEILQQIKTEQNQNNTPKENVVTAKSTTALKGSADKINERK